eukprot:11121354-Lingulodinium_polyedra.AAC.1
MGNTQTALENNLPLLGYCKTRGLQQWRIHDHTDALLTTNLGGPSWTRAAYRTIIYEDTNGKLENT